MSYPGTFCVDDFGTIGAGDDTPAWQGALNAAKAWGSGRGGGVVYAPSRHYTVSSLDFTGCQFTTIEANNSWLHGGIQITPSPILDMTGSSGCRVRGITFGGLNAGGTPSTGVKPLAGLLVAESMIKNDSTANKFYDLGSVGAFGSGALCLIAAPDNMFVGCGFQQWDSSAPCLNMSVHPDWGITSHFKPITDGVGSNMGDTTFLACEFHGNYLNAPYYWTTYMRDCDNVRFIGGNHAVSGGRAHMLFQGHCKRISSIGQSFYSDTGIRPQFMFEVDQAASSVTDLCVVNSNLALTAAGVAGGPGGFPGFRIL